MTTNDSAPALVIIRGTPAAGKSTVTKQVRRRYGPGVVLIDQASRQ